MTLKKCDQVPLIPIEETIAKLEAITGKLESDNYNLTDAMSAFEEGVHLTREAQRNLSEVEQCVRKLTEQGESTRPEADHDTSK